VSHPQAWLGLGAAVESDHPNITPLPGNAVVAAVEMGLITHERFLVDDEEQRQGDATQPAATPT
jgi:hypothetical protein